MRSILRPVSFLLVAAATPLPAQQRTVSLQEALRLSEQVQPDVVRAQGSVLTAAAQRRSAWGAYLPTVSASSSASDFFSQGSSRVDPVTGQLTSGNSSNRSLSTSLSASVDLFTGFRRGADTRAAKANEAAATASLTDARFQQALTTTNAFFDALADRQLVSVRETSVRRAEEQLKVSINKLNAGSATRSDSLRSRVTLGSAQIDLLKAQTDLATAEAALARLIGEMGRVRAADDSTFYRVGVLVDTMALGVEAEEKSPQVQSTIATASASRAAVSAARSAYWPSLTLSGSTAWNASRSQDYDLLNQRQVSLALRWNIFNGFDRELTIAQREAELDLDEATAQDTRRAVAAELTGRMAEWESARKRIDITQTSVAAAAEDLRVQQERYRVGASTIVDVLTSQEALNQAEVDVVVARFDYLRAKAQIEALIGRPL